MIFITLIYEDDLSESIMNKILSHFPGKYEILQSYSGYGFGYLKTNIKGFNQASVVNPHFMLTDLDKYQCPIALIKDWVNFELRKNFIFRIAVREVESWILADREGLSEFFKVPLAIIPVNPDLEPDPKNTLIQLSKRSKRRKIREEIVPINDNASIGPNYIGCLSEFVFKLLDVQNAIKHSVSLEKAVMKLIDFKPEAFTD